VILRSPRLDEFEWLDHGFGTRLSEGWLSSEQYVHLRQIHSDIVVRADQAAGGQLGEGDAMVTAEPGVWLGVRTADCAPVLMADPVRRAAAVVHAGWRGTVESIVVRAIERLHHDFGSEAADLVAVVGPSIGECCFEVGAEVAVQFTPWWPERSDLNRRTRIDLPATLARQLSGANLKAGNISIVGKCTQCDPNLFHSFRRDREAAGRMVSAVRIREV
jgi:YfiH family protein